MAATASGSACTTQGICITNSKWISISGIEFKKWHTNFIFGSTDVTVNDVYLNGSCKENLREKRSSVLNVTARITVTNSIIANSTANYAAAGCTGGELVYLGTDSNQNGGTEDTSNTLTFRADQTLSGLTELLFSGTLASATGDPLNNFSNVLLTMNNNDVRNSTGNVAGGHIAGGNVTTRSE